LVTSNIAAVELEKARHEEISARLTIDVQSYRRVAHIALWRIDVREGAFFTDSTFAATGARAPTFDEARRWPRVRVSCGIRQHFNEALSLAAGH